MKYRVFILFLFVFIFYHFPSELFAQDFSKESVGQENVISYYRSAVGENSSLYRGRLYVGLTQIIKGHQFFDSEEWQSGNLLYQGNLYQEVPILYDIFRDEVLIRHSNGFLKIQLLKDKLDQFTIGNSNFIHIQRTDSASNKISAGIYERIYNGEISVLVKRKKNVKESIQEMQVLKEFEQTNKYYINKDNIYYPVKRKGSVLRVLKDRKKEIRKRMKEEGIKFRRNPELAIVKMVGFYEQAKN